MTWCVIVLAALLARCLVTVVSQRRTLDRWRGQYDSDQQTIADLRDRCDRDLHDPRKQPTVPDGELN
jgi:hypothetical protein